MFENFNIVSVFTPDVLNKYFLLCCDKNGVSDIILNSNDFFSVKKDKVVHKFSAGKKITKNEVVDFLSHIYMSSSLSLLMQGKDLDFSYSIEKSRGKNIMFRVNATSILGKSNNTGIELVFRILPPVPDIKSLIISSYVRNNLVCLDGILKKGIFIVSGETSSGKSTLLAAAIREIITHQNIRFLSFESPIEFDLNLPDIKSIVAQSEIPMHIESYPKATRNALRRNADFLLIGESRDKETIAGAIKAGKTGHCVYTTTHTNNAASIVTRMASEFDSKDGRKIIMLLIESLQGVAHQELVPKKGGGLVALQEALFFTKDIRQEVLNEFSSGDESLITKILEEKIKRHGLTKQAHAKQLLKSGLIEESTFKAVA